jgi:hypothetical protein
MTRRRSLLHPGVEGVVEAEEAEVAEKEQCKVLLLVAIVLRVDEVEVAVVEIMAVNHDRRLNRHHNNNNKIINNDNNSNK